MGSLNLTCPFLVFEAFNSNTNWRFLESPKRIHGDMLTNLLKFVKFLSTCLQYSFTPWKHVSKKEIGNLREPLPTFLNPSQRLQESLRCFGIIHFRTLKWLPKIKGATEKFKNQKRFLFYCPYLSMQAEKEPKKSGATVPLND